MCTVHSTKLTTQTVELTMNDERKMPSHTSDDNDRWGVVVLLAFLIGIPVAGLIYTWLFK
jgi:hypothetical protein